DPSAQEGHPRPTSPTDSPTASSKGSTMGSGGTLQGFMCVGLNRGLSVFSFFLRMATAALRSGLYLCFGRLPSRFEGFRKFFASADRCVFDWIGLPVPTSAREPNALRSTALR